MFIKDRTPFIPIDCPTHVWVLDSIGMSSFSHLFTASVVSQIAFFRLHKWKKWQKGTKAAGRKSRVANPKKLAAFYVAQGQEKPGKATENDEKLRKVVCVSTDNAV